MKLATRLLLLILGCLLPILTAQLFTLFRQHTERQTQVGNAAVRQAELAMHDLTGVILGVRRISLIAARLSGEGTAANCAALLAELRQDVPSLLFIAEQEAADTPRCGSFPTPAAGWAQHPAWYPGIGDNALVGIGRVTTLPGVVDAFLPISVRVPTGPATRTMIVGLDLSWLASHMAAIRPRHTEGQAPTTLYLTDRDGHVIGQDGDASKTGLPVGSSLPEHLRFMATPSTAGFTAIHDRDARVWLAAQVPSPPSIPGLMAIAATELPSPQSDFASHFVLDLLVTGGSALIALVLAWQAGHRFIYLPTEMLLRAAQRWRDGDLNVRAARTGRASEFDALAQSFNAMASSLQARDLERRLQAELLESLVAERTRALSDINNRLQVEIAEREKTEAALHQAQKLQAVGQLAGGIAHDFNNMLATVLGNLELMQYRVEQTAARLPPADAERLMALIERASGAVQRGAQLTSRLLAFSRRQRLAMRPSDLNRLVVELVSLATSTLGRRVRVVTSLAPDLWPAMIDPSQVEAAILNLCLNARDAMPDGGQLTIATANLMFEGGRADDPASGSYVRVSVADTGHGMTPEVRRQAFDPFFTTKGPGGTGLGLSQVYGMARQSGGTVLLESTEGAGTEVTLLLPRASGEVEAESPRRTPATPPPDWNMLQVMVVDDDSAVRQVTVEMLRDLGCAVIQAPSGLDALAMLDTLPRCPDIILLDYAMPGMNGLRVAGAIRDKGLTAAIALVTGYAELDQDDPGATPLDGLLRKPFTIQELRGLLARLRDRIAARGADRV